jgi:capsular polysaccharide biosynthesis protein
MELMQILRVLIRRWFLVVIPVVITAALVVPDLLSRPVATGGFSTMIRYTAAQQLEAVPNRDGDYQDIWLASELTVNALTEWVQSSRFAEAVALKASAAGAEIDPAALSIAADNERSVGQIFINWPDEAQLAAIVQAAIETLQTESQNYFPQLGGAPAQVTILDEPRIVPAPPPITNRLAPLIRVALGLAAGIGLAFLVEYLDPTLRRREDVEALGLNVVASIPRE